MSRISCFECQDGKNGHCDGCNVYEYADWMNHKNEKPVEKTCINCRFFDYLHGIEAKRYCHLFTTLKDYNQSCQYWARR